ncbi:Aspartate--tRNA(Asp/Asn) ligase [Bienertia sinuspersici]
MKRVGNSNKGKNNLIQSVKVIKVNGSVLSFSLNSSSKYLAVGSEQGHISVIDVEDFSILYQKQIGTELSADILRKDYTSHHKRDSSLLALDADTGNTLSSSVVHPKKPSRALSLPDLSFVKDITLRSFASLPVKPITLPDYFTCSSADGEVIMMRGDQEIAVASMFLQNDKYKHLDSLSRVYDNYLTTLEDGSSSVSVHQKEKKKGMFGTLFKDVTGNKTNHGAGTDATHGKASFEELPDNLAVHSFPIQVEASANSASANHALETENVHLDIGKLKQMTTKNEKPSTHEELQIEKTEAVDQIKKKYGFSSSSSNSESSVAEMTKNKLMENVKKLQGISMKTTEMLDNAQTFSSMAKEALRLAEQKNSPSKT